MVITTFPASAFAEEVISTSSNSETSTSESTIVPSPSPTEEPTVTPSPAEEPIATPSPTEEPTPAPTEIPEPAPETTQNPNPSTSIDATIKAPGNSSKNSSDVSKEEGETDQNTDDKKQSEEKPDKAPDGEEEAQKHTGSNEELIRSQNIIDLPEVKSNDWRFQKVDVDRSTAKQDISILAEKKDDAVTVGILSKWGCAYILSDEGDGWIYVESGSVRGFAKSDQFYSGTDASIFRQEESCRMAQNAAANHKKADLSCFNATAQETVSTTDNPAYLYKHLTAGDVMTEKVYGIVSTKSTPLLMREEETADSKTVASIPKGGLVYIIEDDGSDFLYVESGNTKGFVRRQYISSGDDIIKEVEEKGEDTYKQASATVADNENAALYHTFTSVNEYQEVNPIRKKIMDLAQTTLGHPYVWGGNDIYHGCDCSGLVQQIYARFGISLPRVAEAQAQVGTKITPASAQPGDLIFYAENGYIYHVAIYAGEGKTVEAYGTDYGILSTVAFSGRPVCWCTNLIDSIS